MPITDRIVAIAEDAMAWRRDFHAHPELLYDVHRTAEAVATHLRGFGCDEVVTGIGRTGVVGVIRGRGETQGSAAQGRTIALRADMDALPISEQTNLPYRSQDAGKMHACGHDGHTAMLLGAARALCETRNFAGKAIVVFQPAEEGGGGGKAMVESGLMDRFGVDEVYGMHNLPGLAVGQFALRPGAIMASADWFEIDIEGRGGHAALPHECVDPVVVGAAMVLALQTIVSRNADPLDACVVSNTQFSAGSARNVIPSTARLGGTVRTLNEVSRTMIEGRLRTIVSSVAQTYGASATLRYERGYPVTRNHTDQAAFSGRVASGIVGTSKVEQAAAPIMGAEDFSYMLEARPGAFIFVGNGDSAGLHHPAYDFNDAALPYGIGYWLALVETALAV